MRRTSLFTFLLALAICQANAQESRTLSLEDCIGLALQNNSDVVSAQKRIEQYTHTSKALKANFYPRISLQAADLYGTLSGQVPIDVAGPVTNLVGNNFTRLFPSIANGDMGSWFLSTLPERLSPYNQTIDFKMGNVLEAMLLVEQPIYAGGKIISSVKMGKLGQKMSELGKDISEDDAIVKVIEAYSQVVLAREMGGVARQFDSLVTALSDKVQSALDNGMVSQADVMKVRSAVSQSKLQIRQADNGLKLATMNLCHVMGLPLSSDVSIIPIENLDISELPSSIPEVSERKEYEVLQAKTQLAGLQVEMEKSNFRPSVGLALSGGYVDGVKINDNKLFSNELHAFVALNVKIPIYHAGEGRHKIKAAEAEYDQAVIEQQKYNELMALEIQKTLNELDEARLNLNLQESICDQADESLRISQKKYSLGMSTITDLLEAQTQCNKAHTDLADAKHLYILKEASFLKASGKLQEKYSSL